MIHATTLFAVCSMLHLHARRLHSFASPSMAVTWQQQLRHVVLCVQLVSSVGPCFLLHCMPTSWEASNQPRNNLAKTISCAGEGQGLQVFPGSVQEVTPVSRAEGRRLDWVGRLPWGDLDRLDSLRQLQHTLCMLQIDVLQRLVVSGCLG